MGALAALIRHAHELSPLCWTITLFKKKVRLNGGPVQSALLKKKGLLLVVDGPSLSGELRQRLGGRIKAENHMAMVPESVEVLLPWEDFDALLPETLEAAKRFVERATQQGKRRSSYVRSHSPGLLGAFEELLGETLPRRPVSEVEAAKKGPDVERLQEAFETFRNTPWHAFTVHLRRRRA